jgi:hypothetical protein
MPLFQLQLECGIAVWTSDSPTRSASRATPKGEIKSKTSNFPTRVQQEAARHVLTNNRIHWKPP